MSDLLYARDSYGKTLVELGKKYTDIVVLDADLSGSTRTALFAREFPERFFNFGVAEQNMMATAAGLARCGKIVFASTFAMFASARALDQIRNTICYNKLNVKIVASHGGITVGEDGASHQALEDIAYMRVIPNMHIVVPADAHETAEAVRAAYHTPGPFYIRLGRSKVPTLANREKFVLGKGSLISQGKDIAIIACGIMVNEALKAKDLLSEKNINPAIYNFSTIKPLDCQLLIEIAKKYKKILVAEEHQIIGGLYSAVCEQLAANYPVKVYSIAVRDKFGQSGSPEALINQYGLSYKHIADKIETALSE